MAIFSRGRPPGVGSSNSSSSIVTKLGAPAHLVLPGPASSLSGIHSPPSRRAPATQPRASINASASASYSRPLGQTFTPGPPSSTRQATTLGWRTGFAQEYSLQEYKVLGQGSFGFVHEGVDLTSGTPVAVKVLPKVLPTLLKDGNLKNLCREIDVLQRLQGCPSVVQLRGHFEDESQVQIVMELCMGEDLQKLVHSSGTLSEHALALVAVQILRVIGMCHSHGIVHADIKPANFCLKSPCEHPLAVGGTGAAFASSSWLKALDFGTSQMLPDGSGRLSKRTGTPAFIAPEVFARNYGLGADMWSFGVTLYWLYTKRFPFFDEAAARTARLDEVLHAVIHAPIPYDDACWQQMSGAGVDFVQRCLQRDESERMSVQQAMQHPWLQEAIAASGLLPDQSATSAAVPDPIAMSACG